MRTLVPPVIFSTALHAMHPPPSFPDLAGIARVACRLSDVQKFGDFYSALGFEQAFQFADPGKPVVSYSKMRTFPAASRPPVAAWSRKDW